MAGSRDRCSSACASTAGNARVRPSTGAGFSIDRCRASRLEKSKSAVRHCSTLTGSKSCASIFLTSSSSNGSTCPVTPKVPSRRCRPARPAIWPSSAGRKVPELIAVEFAVLGEGDMVNVEIEAHADRVGGDQIVDIAGLVELDLGIAGARAERAQHDRGATALAPHQLGDGVNLVGREGDNRRAAAAGGSVSSGRHRQDATAADA